MPTLSRMMMVTAAATWLAAAGSLALAQSAPDSMPEDGVACALDHALCRELYLRQSTVGEVLQYLEGKARLKFNVDWAELGKIGVEASQNYLGAGSGADRVPGLRQVTPRVALRHVLEALATKTGRPDYVVEGKTIRISTADAIGKMSVRVVYDVSQFS